MADLTTALSPYGIDDRQRYMALVNAAMAGQAQQGAVPNAALNQNLTPPQAKVPATTPAEQATKGLAPGMEVTRRTRTNAPGDIPRPPIGETIQDVNAAGAAATEAVKTDPNSVEPIDISSVLQQMPVVPPSSGYSANPAAATAENALLTRPPGTVGRDTSLQTQVQAGPDAGTWDKVKEFMTNPAVPMAALFGMGFFAGDTGGVSGIAQGFARGMAAMGEGVQAQRAREDEQAKQDVSQQNANTAQLKAAADLASTQRVQEAELGQKQKGLELQGARIANDFNVDANKFNLALQKEKVSRITNKEEQYLKMQEIATKLSAQDAMEKWKLNDPEAVKERLFAGAEKARASAEFYGQDGEKAFMQYITDWNRYMQNPERLTKPLPAGEATPKKEAPAPSASNLRSITQGLGIMAQPTMPVKQLVQAIIDDGNKIGQQKDGTYVVVGPDGTPTRKLTFWEEMGVRSLMKAKGNGG